MLKHREQRKSREVGTKIEFRDFDQPVLIRVQLLILHLRASDDTSRSIVLLEVLLRTLLRFVTDTGVYKDRQSPLSWQQQDTELTVQRGLVAADDIVFVLSGGGLARRAASSAAAARMLGLFLVVISVLEHVLIVIDDVDTLRASVVASCRNGFQMRPAWRVRAQQGSPAC